MDEKEIYSEAKVELIEEVKNLIRNNNEKCYKLDVEYKKQLILSNIMKDNSELEIDYEIFEYDKFRDEDRKIIWEKNRKDCLETNKSLNEFLDILEKL